MNGVRTAERTRAGKGAAASRAASPRRRCACGQHTGGGACSSCQKGGAAGPKPAALQARLRISGMSGVDRSAPSVADVLRGPGRPLAPRDRAPMEERFGRDFSHVRLHTDASAARSARAEHARAYTAGHHIVFGAGQFSTGTTRGRQLLAHELAHVAQQASSANGARDFVRASRSLERNADAAAGAVAAGRRPHSIGSSSQPLFARQAEQRTIPQSDGSEVVVTRTVIPGRCRLIEETRTSVSRDITTSGAFLEITSCRGNVSGGGRAELNYDQALSDASGAVSDLLGNLMAGQSPDSAFGTFRNDLAAVTPEAELSFNLDTPGFRAQISGTAGANLGGQVSGRGSARVEVDVGPVTIGVEPSVSGGTDERTQGQVLVTVGNRRRRDDPNCFICACAEPRLQHTCSRLPPPAEPASRLEPKIITLYFEFEKTTPRPGWEAQYRRGIADAVTLIGQGYRVARIIGNASPEGPQTAASPGARFRGNIDLAQRRAREARDNLNAVLQARINGLQMRGLDHLQAALQGNYPVEGRGELFGTANGTEIANRDLNRRLRTDLRAPTGDAPDPLQQRNVIGEGLEPAVRADAERQVAEFRAGRGSAASLFPLFRRALIFLEPPQPVIDLTLSPEALERVIGRAIPCTPEHLRVFANAPPSSDGLFEGEECNRPGQRP